MHLEQIQIKQFKCFEQVDLALGNNTGFFFLTGDNKENLTHGANAIGKTSFFDAICWGLYGKTADGLAAKELLNNNCKGGYSVKLTFDNCKIERSWNPNTIRLNGQIVEQESIEDYLKMNFDQFLYCVYFSQGADHFIDMTPGGKIDFLSEVFELEKWTKYGDHAKLKAKTESELHQKAKTDKAVAESTIESLSAQTTLFIEQKKQRDDEDKQTDIGYKNQLEALKAESVDWVAQRDFQVNDMKQQLEELKRGCPNPMEDTSQEQLANIDTKIRQLGLGTTEKFLQECKHTKAVLENKLKDKKSEVEKLIGQETPTCLTCGQPMPQLTRDEIGKRLIQEIKDGQLAYLEQTTNIEAAEKSAAEIQAIIDGLQKEKEAVIIASGEARSANAVYEQTQSQIRIKEAQIAAKEQEKNPYDKQIQLVETELSMPKCENPFIKMIDDNKVKIAQGQVHLQECIEKEKAHAAQLARYEFWQKKFPLVRFNILEEMSLELEIHFNQALSSIGLTNWQIKVDMDRKLADEKTTKKEFVMNILKNGKVVNIKTLSGSERKRLRIASAVGMSDLITSRLGADWSQRFYDEPGTSLSAEGFYCMLDFLSGLAEARQIFLADHRIEGMDRFDRVITVTKAADGNSTICMKDNPSQRQLAAIS